MHDMLTRRRVRSIEKALKPYEVEVGPARCPNCKKVVGLYRRSIHGLTCKDCLVKSLQESWPPPAFRDPRDSKDYEQLVIRAVGETVLPTKKEN